MIAQNALQLWYKYESRSLKDGEPEGIYFIQNILR